MISNTVPHVMVDGQSGYTRRVVPRLQQVHVIYGIQHWCTGYVITKSLVTCMHCFNSRCSKIFLVSLPKFKCTVIQVFCFFPLFLFLFRRQDELQARLIEEETARRVEELVAKRVQEELERRKDEIEAEVLRRVEEAKKVGTMEIYTYSVDVLVS